MLQNEDILYEWKEIASILGAATALTVVIFTFIK